MILIYLLPAMIALLREIFVYPEFLIYPYLTTIGLLPYKQILDQHFPGLMFFPINFYSLGFTTLASFRPVLILTIIVQSMLIYKLTKKIAGVYPAMLAVIFYGLWQPIWEGNILWIDSFLGIFALLGAINFWNKKWFWTGFWLGWGIIFKQTLLLLGATVGILIWKQAGFRKAFRYGLVLVVPSILMLIYYFSQRSLGDFWFWTVLFNLSNYAKEGGLKPVFSEIIKLSVPVLIVLPGILQKNLRWLYLWGIFSVVGGISRFGLIHFQPLLPFLAIVFGLIYQNSSKNLTKIILLGSLILLGIVLSKSKWSGVKFEGPTDNLIVQKIEAKTIYHDSVFILGAQPHYYALSQTRPAGSIFVFQLPWFLKLSESRILQGLKADPPKLIVYDPLAGIDGQKLADYAPELVKYMQDNYYLTDTVKEVGFYESRN